MNHATDTQKLTGYLSRLFGNTWTHTGLRRIVADSVNTAMTVFDAAVEVPEDGLVLYSEKLSSHPRFFYNLQIRLTSTRCYALAWQHSSGHLNINNDCQFQHLEEAAHAFLQSKWDYVQAERDDRAEAHSVNTRLISRGVTQ